MPIKKRLKKLKNDVIYLVISFFLRLLRNMERRPAIAVVRFIGRTAFLVSANERKKTIDNLTWAFGRERSDREIRQLAKAVFDNLSTCVADAFRLPNLTREGLDKIVNVEGIEHLDAALAKKKGVLIQTGHYGNWELLGTWLALKGYPIKVIAKKSYDPRLDRLINDYRNKAGYAVTSRGNALQTLVQGLKGNAAFGLLFDIDTKVKGDFVTFFGKPAHTATIPATLAMQFGSPIVPIFIRLNPDLTYTISGLPPVDLVDTGNPEQDVLTNTQRCSDVYERQIRKHPEQWIWMHERWKKKPASDR